jgi:hypothetical protein
VDDPTAAATPTPGAPTWAVGAAFLAAGVVVLGAGTLVGPDSRAPRFWGLLLCCIALPSFRAAYVTFKEAEAASIGTAPPERSLLPGLVIILLPVALSVGFLVTDPAPWSESLYAVAVAVTAWAALSILWGSWRARRQVLGSTEPPPRAPGVVRLFWPMVPGFALLWFALTGPGSSSYGCDDGATCFDGPIALSIPALLVLVVGVIAGVSMAKGSSVDRTMRVQLPGFVPKGLDARINRLAELGRLRSAGVIDDAEFERLKEEVVDPPGPPQS